MCKRKLHTNAAILWLILLQSAAVFAQSIRAPQCSQSPRCMEYQAEAQEAFAAGNYKQALDAYCAAFSIEPEAALLLNIGRTTHKLGLYNEALSHLEKARAMAPDDAYVQLKSSQFISDTKAMLSSGSIQASAAKVQRPLSVLRSSPQPAQFRPDITQNLQINVFPIPQPPVLPGLPNSAKAEPSQDEKGKSGKLAPPTRLPGWSWAMLGTGVVGAVAIASGIVGYAVSRPPNTPSQPF